MQRAPQAAIAMVALLLSLPPRAQDGANGGECTACHGRVLLPPAGQGPGPVRSSHLAAGLTCASCHDGHAGLRPLSEARWTVSDLDGVSRFCAGCHSDYGEDGDAGGRRHPVGGSVSCVTCHVVHVSASERLFRWKPGGMAAACCTCHDVC
jgi:hypothetical protein